MLMWTLALGEAGGGLVFGVCGVARVMGVAWTVAENHSWLLYIELSWCKSI